MFSQKKFFWGIVGIVLCILIYTFVLLPLVHAKKRVEEEIILKKKTLFKYDGFLRNRKVIEEELARARSQYEGVQIKLMAGDTPQLGAANLQEVVKRVSDKNGVQIRSFRILEPKEGNVYRKISIQIDFNPISNMKGLAQFIYEIENGEKELMISEINLIVLNIRMPSSVQGSMVITGLMKGTGVKPKEKGSER